MRVLALDCSQLQASVCLIEDGRLATAETGSVDVAHSEALLPYIDQVLKRAQWTLASLDFFAVGIGPGSFTGIRIGCATVKALAQVLVKPIIPFSSLRATALSLADSAMAMVNAYQGQVFVGWSDPLGHWREEAFIPEKWCEQWLVASSVAICGSGVKVYAEALLRTGNGLVRLHPEVAYATPAGIMAAVLENQKNALRYDALAANYLRPSQAEIKLSSSIAK